MLDEAVSETPKFEQVVQYFEQKLTHERMLQSAQGANGRRKFNDEDVRRLDESLKALNQGDATAAWNYLQDRRGRLEADVGRYKSRAGAPPDSLPDDKEYRELNIRLSAYGQELRELDRARFPHAYDLLQSEYQRAFAEISLTTTRGMAKSKLATVEPELRWVSETLSVFEKPATPRRTS